MAIKFIPLYLLLTCMPYLCGQSLLPPRITEHTRVRIYDNREAKFQQYVSELTPNISGSSEFRAAQQYIVLITNEMKVPVRAVAINWVGLRDIKGLAPLSTVLNEPGDNAYLPGMRQVLAPGESALFTPFGLLHLSLTESEGVRQLSDFLHQLAEAHIQSSERGRLALFDAIVTGNGIVTGLDSSNLAERYACEANGAIEAAQSLRYVYLDNHLLLETLHANAILPLTSPSCLDAFRRESLRLQLVLDREGLNALKRQVDLLSTHRQITLTHLNSIR